MPRGLRADASTYVHGSGDRGQPEPPDEAHRVVRRVPPGVVVEVDVDVVPLLHPVVAGSRPPVEGLVRVAAGVELGLAVQPHVAESLVASSMTGHVPALSAITMATPY